MSSSRPDHLGVDVLGGCRPGRQRAMPAARGPREQRLAHLGAAGVLPADEENGGHGMGIITLTDVI